MSKAFSSLFQKGMRGQKSKVIFKRSKEGGNLGAGGCGAILTGVRFAIAAGGGWAPGGLGEAVGPLWDGAADTSALRFRSLLGHSEEGSGLSGTTEHDK